MWFKGSWNCLLQLAADQERLQLLFSILQLQEEDEAAFEVGINLIFFLSTLSNHLIIPSPPSVAYMRQWTGSALVPKMACRLCGAMQHTQHHGNTAVIPRSFKMHNVEYICTKCFENFATEDEYNFHWENNHPVDCEMEMLSLWNGFRQALWTLCP